MTQVKQAPRILSEAEWIAQGQQVYDSKVRALVETEENIGKHVIVNVNTGEYEIDRNALVATERALILWPASALFGVRVGYDAEFRV